MTIQCSFQRALGNDFDGFGSEMGAKMDPKWVIMVPKCSPKTVSGRGSRSDAFWASFGVKFSLILERFWDDFLMPFLIVASRELKT